MVTRTINWGAGIAALKKGVSSGRELDGIIHLSGSANSATLKKKLEEQGLILCSERIPGIHQGAPRRYWVEKEIK